MVQSCQQQCKDPAVEYPGAMHVQGFKRCVDGNRLRSLNNIGGPYIDTTGALGDGHRRLLFWITGRKLGEFTGTDTAHAETAGDGRKSTRCAYWCCIMQGVASGDAQ